MPTPTELEIKTAEDCFAPWPDISHITYKAPVVAAPVETRACVRCQRPVTGDRCDHCRAHQNTYGGER